MLTVKGEKRGPQPTEGEDYFFSEREYGRFQRSFRLPPDADADKTAAAFSDGVLRITVPRRGGDAGKAKKIKVRAA